MATQEDQVALATALLGIVSSVGTIAETAETLRVAIPREGLENYESFLGLMEQHKMFCEWLVARLLDGFDAETIEAAKKRVEDACRIGEEVGLKKFFESIPVAGGIQ